MTTTSSSIRRTFGKYELRRLLGKGGMGDVYEAYDTDKSRTVALKILAAQYSHDDGFRTRFQRESHSTAILQEPHVIPIHDWGEIDGNLYIDMRLVKGQTLHQLLKSGPLEAERAVFIITQVAAALDAAHAEGLVHRDVKPQNIIVTPADFAYLLDFGIAEARDDTHLTMTGQCIGSLHYMAPERFTGQSTTAAADVYSLACVLYESLAGTPPFSSHKLEQSMAAHLTAPPPRPSLANPAVAAAFDGVVARGMAKDPDDRYGSAGALGRAAQQALQTNAHDPFLADTVLAPPPSAPPQYDGRRRKVAGVTTAAVVTTAVLLVAAIGVLVGLLVSRRPATTISGETTLAHPAPSTYTITETTAYPTAPLPEPNPITSIPADAEMTSLQQLRQLADSDRPYVSADLADRWVPQLSSKRPGIVDDGIVWNNDNTLREHLRLRQQYPGVRLLWSGDWSTFAASDFWITVVGITFPDSSGALAWCRYQAFDRDHCVAKVVSTTRAAAGSTAYN